MLTLEQEKQLAVWWVEQVLESVLGTRDLRRMHELCTAQIPDRMKSAKVFLDCRPCDNVSQLSNLGAGIWLTAVLHPVLRLSRPDPKGHVHHHLHRDQA